MAYSHRSWSLCLLLIFLISCAGPELTSNFDPAITTLNAPPKSPEQVEILYQKPFRSLVYLGEIRIDSPHSKPTSFEAFVREAREKAAKIGADFIEVLKTDHASPLQKIPSATLNSETQQAETYDTLDPRLNLNETTISAMIAKPGRYCPTKLGIIYDPSFYPRYVIRAFDDQSRALRAGLKIGDEVILIDSLRLDDPRLAEKSMTVKPGDEAKVTIIRDNQQRSYQVIRIPNP